MRIIVLTQGKGAQVDNRDYARLSQYKYFAVASTHTWYAVRNAYVDGRRTTICLHRDVLETDSPHIEHRNRNGLDCRRRNLRAADHSQNAHNRPAYGKKSPYKGVYPIKSKWIARFIFRGKIYQSSRFATPELAAYAYNLKTSEIIGEFAYKNVIPDITKVASEFDRCRFRCKSRWLRKAPSHSARLQRTNLIPTVNQCGKGGKMK